MLRKLGSLVLGVTLLSSMAGIAGNAETFNMSTYAPVSHWLVKDALGQWVKNVSKETEGRVKINILPTKLGKSSAHFALARDGIADITLGVPGYTPGRFVLVEVAGIPKIGFTGEGLSVGLWRTFQASPELRAEFDGVKVLGLFTTDPEVPLLTNKKVETLADFKGLKMRVAGGMMKSVAEAVGMTPVSAPAPKAYELLSTGVIDGIVFPISDVRSFKLERLIKFIPNIPGGIAAAPIFVVMNTEKFNKLSKEDQDGLMRASGESLSRIVGRLWDEKAKEVSDVLRKHGGEVYVPDAAFMKAYDKAIEPAIAGWIEEAKVKRKVDGRKLMQIMRTETAKIEKQN